MVVEDKTLTVWLPIKTFCGFNGRLLPDIVMFCPPSTLNKFGMIDVTIGVFE